MDYLDYLTHCTYDELPAEARDTIERDDYERRRAVALGVSGDGAALPPVLATAFRGYASRPRVANQPVGYRWAAAAGWILFVGTAVAWGLAPEKSETIYRVLAAEPPTPEVITKTDTVYEVRTNVRVARDTLRLAANTPEPITVYQIDTVYLPEGSPPPINGSSTLRGKERVLELMVGAE